MGYEPATDLPVPEHDPVADEQDLLTVLEASARLHDNLVEARAQLASLLAGTGSAPPERAAALRTRIEVLESGMRRYDELRRDRAHSR